MKSSRVKKNACHYFFPVIENNLFCILNNAKNKTLVKNLIFEIHIVQYMLGIRTRCPAMNPAYNAFAYSDFIKIVFPEFCE